MRCKSAAYACAVGEGGEAEKLAEELQHGCPAFFREDDRIFYRASGLLQQAESGQTSPADRAALTREALRLMLQAILPPHPPLQGFTDLEGLLDYEQDRRQQLKQLIRLLPILLHLLPLLFQVCVHVLLHFPESHPESLLYFAESLLHFPSVLQAVSMLARFHTTPHCPAGSDD